MLFHSLPLPSLHPIYIYIQAYLQRTAPRLHRSRSPSLRRIAMTTKRICWRPLRNQTSLADRSVGLLWGGGYREEIRGVERDKEAWGGGGGGVKWETERGGGKKIEREGTASQ